MEKITSLQNALVRQALGLRESRERRLKGLTIIDGVREISRALEAGIALEKVFYVKGRQEALLKRLRAQKIETIEVSDKVMDKLAYGERHEGVVALGRTPAITLKDLTFIIRPLVVVLESLEKPGNLGAILRTCDAVGVEAVLVCDPRTDVYNPNVIRSSTGVVFKIPVVCASAQEISAFLKSHKIKTYACTPSASQLYTQPDLRDASALVLGSEEKGLSDFWLSTADMAVKIPMKGLADSLNVSTAAAVILYEALRQRN
ncbi:MAG: RNA methyltransferase [Candidatus Omnitrophica bacterium]|nr:RNA methyltransferase [Candidatus Omnitrophota bacterium]MDE2222428.1 RNA methyltransferase [Candidatus Omnitrophota bacterium]